MSMSGVTLEAGITDYGVGEIQVKNNAREREARIALADSKFGQNSFIKVCGRGSRTVCDGFQNQPGYR